MLLNDLLIVAVVALVALVAWWLVRAIGELRHEDAGRNERLDVEAAAVLLVLGLVGITLSGNAAIQVAGGVALLAGAGAGYSMLRQNRL